MGTWLPTQTLIPGVGPNTPPESHPVSVPWCLHTQQERVNDGKVWLQLNS